MPRVSTKCAIVTAEHDAAVLAVPPRIAVSGKIASGKSTLAAAIARRLGSSTRRTSFAARIREIILDLHGPGRDKDRALLTGIGMLHRGFNPDTWLDTVRRTVSREVDIPWVLDDLRFDNERRGLAKDGWTLVRVRVGDEERSRRLVRAYGEPEARAHAQFATHPSETGLDAVADDAFDVIVTVVDADTPSSLPCYWVTDTNAHTKTLVRDLDSVAASIVGVARRKEKYMV